LTSTLDGTLELTTLPAPITLPSPIAALTMMGPGAEPHPVADLGASRPRPLLSPTVRSWPLPSKMLTFQEMPHSAPIVMCSQQVMTPSKWMKVWSPISRCALSPISIRVPDEIRTSPWTVRRPSRLI
jgi:hypothetical protein